MVHVFDCFVDIVLTIIVLTIIIIIICNVLLVGVTLPNHQTLKLSYLLLRLIGALSSAPTWQCLMLYTDCALPFADC